MSKRNGGGAIRVLVAATSAVRRAGLESIIRSQPDFQLAASTGSLARLGLHARNSEADVVVADSDSLPELADSPGSSIVLLTEISDARTIARLLKAGVRAILPRETDPDEIVSAIYAAYSGHVLLSARAAENLAAVYGDRAVWEAPPRPEGGLPMPNESAGPLRVRFWGTRGSLPAPLRERTVRAKIRDALLAARGHALETEQAIDAFIDRSLPFSVRGTFGGNTSCVEIITGGDEYVICDLGTGVREFGNRVLREHGPGRKHTFNIFLSHPHWDHIMGFPFFAPAYIPGNRICIYGCHGVLREALRTQHSAPWFPVDFHSLGSSIEFITLEPDRTYEVAGLSVTSIKTISHGRFLRVSLFQRREVDRLLDRLRAQDVPISTKPTRSSSSTETPTC